MNKISEVPFLIGPTAGGKTALALALAKIFPIEIISVDSALVYRGMDIGTGKPTPEERSLVPHHLINIRDLHEPYSTFDFCTDANEIILDILMRGKMPLVVGGTLLYVNALLEGGLSELPSKNKEIRAQLTEQAKTNGLASLYKRLEEVDQPSASKIHANDTQRIIRALEVYTLTGVPMSSLINNSSQKVTKFPHNIKFPQNIKPKLFALNPKNRSDLHAKIEARFNAMLAEGFLEEVKQLNQIYPDNNLAALRAVGYRQLLEHINGHIDFKTSCERAIAATRQLAKRQITWLRSLNKRYSIIWLENAHLDSLQNMIHSLS